MSRTEHSDKNRELLRLLSPDRLPEKKVRSLVRSHDSSLRVTLPYEWLNRENVNFDNPDDVAVMYYEDESKIVIDLQNAEA
jgi:hypothetical protein